MWSFLLLFSVSVPCCTDNNKKPLNKAPISNDFFFPHPILFEFIQAPVIINLIIRASYIHLFIVGCSKTYHKNNMYECINNNGKMSLLIKDDVLIMLIKLHIVMIIIFIKSISESE